MSAPRQRPVASEYPTLWDTKSQKPDPTKWLTGTLDIALQDALPKDAFRPLACAAWAIVMAQYTGRDDVCFGIISHEPDGQPITEAFMIGCESSLTVKAMVNQSKVNASTAHTFSPDTVPARNYLAFNLNSSLESSGADSLCWTPPPGSALVISLVKGEQVISLRAAFDSTAVGEEEIRLLLNHFSEAFRQVTSPAHQLLALGELDLFTSKDEAFIQRWNVQPPEPSKNLLHVLFKKVAQESRDKTALVFRGKTVTYGELDIASSNLAYRIEERADLFDDCDFIPVIMEKCPEVIVSMLAVLKAGRAFVPIDPAYPKARRDHILKSLQAKGVLVSKSVHDLQLFDSTIQLVVVTESNSQSDKSMCQNTHRRRTSIDPSQPAYLLFTSGSTGIPKGVVLEHRNVCTAMQEFGKKFILNSETRMFQYTSFTFDPSVLEIFGTLLHGGCICIPTEAERLNDIPNAIEEMQVNTAVFVPSVLKLLHPEQIPTVKKLIIGGEELPRSLIDLWGQGTQLINAYGPTETCVCSLANLQAKTGRYGGNIGNPIACRAWVVNPRNQAKLMPVGAIGELWIQGPTVARGYLHNEAATEASFSFSLPWATDVQEGAARVYRTGDLVRYLPDGSLLFLGRKDKQIKLNGHRIEVGEIEAVIRSSSFALDASVQLLSIVGSSPTLAAFSVPTGIKSSSETECELLSRINDNHDIARLREYLQAQLPTHMIPEYILSVSSIPRMTSGKVDRRRLTSILEQVRLDRLEIAAQKDCRNTESVLSETCAVMRNLWAQVLGMPSPSIPPSARFLNLGGNSIKAMKLVAAARSSGLLLTVDKVLTNNCTLEEMTKSAEPATTDEAAAAKPTAASLSRREYIPTWIQMVSLTTVGAFPEGNYTRIILELRGHLDLHRLHQAAQSLVARNEILRTRYSLSESTIKATVVDPSEVEVPILRFESRSEALTHWESDPPASCFERQLVEFSYVAIDELATHFSLGLQHSQYDAWTVPLLLRQLQSLYRGHDTICSGPLFSEYATKLPHETNPGAEKFWKEQLAGVSMTMLTNDASTTEGDEPDGHLRQSFKISPSQFTFATIIYTAWALILSKYASSGAKVVFGGAVSGRNMDMDGILDVVGPCINMVPFAVDVSNCKTNLDALQTVQRTMIATVPYEAMPMPDIITRCTDWNPTAVFGSIVQHLDVTFDLPSLPGAKSSVGATSTDILEWKFLETRKRYGRCRATDIYIFSTTTNDGMGGDVQMKFNPSRIKPELAEMLFSDLCQYIDALMQSPEK